MGAFQQVTYRDVVKHCRENSLDPEWEKKHEATKKRLRGCVGKKAFPSMETAQGSVRDPEIYDVYKCRWCSFWHVGHKKGKKKRIKVL